MGKFEVIFYKRANGSCPVCDFLDSLDIKMRAKMLRLTMLLEKNGNELREPYSKFLKDGIFEIRAKLGSNIARVLYFFSLGKIIILTNGFVKKTAKTPSTEIELAQKYRTDYLRKTRDYDE